MGESKRDLEALSRYYAELGFDYSVSEIEKFLPRIEQAEAALDVVRALDESGQLAGYESALTFVPRRMSEGMQARGARDE